MECESGQSPSANCSAKCHATTSQASVHSDLSLKEEGDLCVQRLGFPTQVEKINAKEMKHFTLKHSKNVTACDIGDIMTKRE